MIRPASPPCAPRARWAVAPNRPLLLLSGASLPTARVMILPAAATPLNHGVAFWARPRPVQTVFLERAARFTPLRVRTDHICHTTIQPWGRAAWQGVCQGGN